MVEKVWEIDEGKHNPGEILHTLGWPLDQKTYGGSFLYHMNDRQVKMFSFPDFYLYYAEFCFGRNHELLVFCHVHHCNHCCYQFYCFHHHLFQIILANMLVVVCPDRYHQPPKKKKKKINIKLKCKKTSWLSASDCHHTRILIAFIFLHHGRFICNIVLGVVIKHVSQVFKHHYWQVFWITSSLFGIADFLSFYFGWSFRSHWALLLL